MATISTTNITGLRDHGRGSSLWKASPMAGSRMAGSISWWQMFCDRVHDGLRRKCRTASPDVRRSVPATKRGKEGQAAHDQDDADQKPDEQPPWVGKVPAEAGTIFLAASDPATAIIGTMNRKRPISIAKPSVEIVEDRVGGEAGKGAAIVAGGGGEGIEDFAEAVRPAVEGPARPAWAAPSQRGRSPGSTTAGSGWPASPS